MPVTPPNPANFEFTLDQVLHLLSPLLVAIVTLLTAAGRAIWKKLNMMQKDIDGIKEFQTRVCTLHELNHPGQELD